LQVLLSESKGLRLFRKLLEDQAELETAALLRAETPEQLNYLRGRIAALLHIADLPQRVATTLKEHYDRADAKRAADERPPDISGHWGSPNYADLWDRVPADRRGAYEPSGAPDTLTG
jgi:hypothetical protein